MSQFNGWFIFFNFAFGILMAFACYHQAKKLGREPFIWGILGFLFGIFPLLFLYFTRKKAPEAPKKANTPPEVIPLSLPFDSKYWYYLDPQHQSQGPMDFLRLKDAWKSQVVQGQSYVWYDKMSEWKKVDEVDSLRAQLETN